MVLKELNIIGFHIRKGGVGKTTVATNLAVTIKNKTNTNVLLLDLDPQANATSSFLTDEQINEGIKSQTNLWFEKKVTGEQLLNTIIDSRVEGVFYVQTDETLEEANLKLSLQQIGRERNLANNILKIEKYLEQLNIKTIIIDMPPAWSYLTLNGYICAQSGVIQVIEPSKFALDTLFKNLNIWSKEMEEIGMENNIKGILLNKAKGSKNTKDMYSILNSQMPEIIFSTIVPDSIAISNSVLRKNKWAIEEVKLNNWKIPKWVEKHPILSKNVKAGNPFENLLIELIKRKILK